MTDVVDRMLSFDGSGLKRWNYSNSNKEDYIADQITGDLIEISFPQKKTYNPNNPGQGNLEFWPDGNPKRNVMFLIKGQSGKELGWEFTPSKNSLAKNAVIDAIKQAVEAEIMPDTDSIKALCPGNGKGYNITIATQPGTYGAGNPRPWHVTINGPAKNPSDVSGVAEPEQPQAKVQQVVDTPAQVDEYTSNSNIPF